MLLKGSSLCFSLILLDFFSFLEYYVEVVVLSTPVLHTVSVYIYSPHMPTPEYACLYLHTNLMSVICDESILFIALLPLVFARSFHFILFPPVPVTSLIIGQLDADDDTKSPETVSQASRRAETFMVSPSSLLVCVTA